MRQTSVKGWALIATLVFSSGALGETSVFDFTLPALMKVLAYDTNFDARGRGQFTVLIVAEAGMEKRRDEVLASASDLIGTKIRARPVRYLSVDFRDEPQLQAEIERSGAAALLVVPGMPSPRVQLVWEIAQDNQMYALALEAKMVEQVLPVGVTMSGTRPQIVINEKSALAVGVRFETSVLKLARVIRQQ